MAQSSTGGSGAFLGVASDGNRYWIKTLNNGQHSQRVPLNELVVGRCAQLAALPACRVQLVRIPDELAGWEFRPGMRLEPGYASGSFEQSNVVEVRSLNNSARDSNAFRYVGVEALWDWCWGQDQQWLESVTEDTMVFDHDHGHYFPDGPNWTIPSLDANEATPHAVSLAGGSAVEAGRIAAAFDAVSPDDIGRILAGVPHEWPVTDDELAHLGAFLIRRAPDAAARLRSRYGVP